MTITVFLLPHLGHESSHDFNCDVVLHELHRILSFNLIFPEPNGLQS